VRALLLVGLVACSDAAPKGWMATVDDATPLAALSIPGTHDSGALYEPFPGLAKCQDLTIADQLAAGVRYFDIRCHHFQDQFLIYHGSIDQNQSFDEVLATMFAFLDKHPTEALIVSIKEEGDAMMPVRSFEATFGSYLDLSRDRWYTGAAVPMLGDVRGKLVLLRRFDAAASPLGIDASPSLWLDNASFAITHPGPRCRSKTSTSSPRTTRSGPRSPRTSMQRRPAIPRRCSSRTRAVTS
jgi:1-phosphatidylinositol phosphodiesterase